MSAKLAMCYAVCLEIDEHGCFEVMADNISSLDKALNIRKWLAAQNQGLNDEEFIVLYRVNPESRPKMYLLDDMGVQKTLKFH